MMSSEIDLSPNALVRFLGKEPAGFTRDDLVRFVAETGIQMVNFRYPAGDGRLKTLNFAIHSRAFLERILTSGERVDGSSLFTEIDTASSDLYVVPRYRTAFVDPFTELPTLDILCSFFDSQGNPLASAPENVLLKAQYSLGRLGYSMYAMGELEYYVLHDPKSLFPVTPQGGYHESSPFSKFAELRCEAMHAIAQSGGKVKYGHSEVGTLQSDGVDMEQHEIEFLPVPVEEAADQLVVAKWILRMLAFRYGVTLSFAPKVMVGHAGSGLHIHTMLVGDGKNAFSDGTGITEVARRVIAGYLDLAPSLTAFGNTVPLSYLRLVPHQEAPTNVCWGDRNRSVLVRVPLGWHGVDNMTGHANPDAPAEPLDHVHPQTVEFRSPDGSADIYGLLAGLTVAARHGLEMPDALDLARRLYVDVNIFSSDHEAVQKELPQLPASCCESADELLKARRVYEQDDVFTPGKIGAVAARLKAFKDTGTSERLCGHNDDIRALVQETLHVM
jgi:glutamine synthetase